jgi:hypothetical protein
MQPAPLSVGSQESFMHHFTPGVHYEAVRYDLADLPMRTLALLQVDMGGRSVVG